MDAYNRELDSIGTEISYSNTSDVPESRKKTGNIPSNNKIVQNAQNNQSGGFLNFLFGEGDSSLKQKGTLLTQMIIDAIDKGEYQEADVLMKRPFMPDLSVVNDKGENLLHVLIQSKDKMRYAGESLVQMIVNKANVAALNAPDLKGRTPFYDAVAKGYHDLAEFMEKHGAKRTVEDQDFAIVTDKDVESGIYDAQSGRLDTSSVVLSPHRHSPEKSSKSSIFSKQVSTNTPQLSVTRESKDNTIADIVNAFKTANESTDYSVDITRTDVNDSAMNKMSKDDVINRMKDMIGSLKRRSPSHQNQTPVRPSPKRTMEIFQVPHPQSQSQHYPHNSPGKPLQNSPGKTVSHLNNPLSSIDSQIDSDSFVKLLAQKIANEQSSKVSPKQVPIRQSSPDSSSPDDTMYRAPPRQMPVKQSSPGMDFTPNKASPVKNDTVMQDPRSEPLRETLSNLTGGSKHRGSNYKPITTKTTKVTGTRKMVGFSEVDEEHDMFGGMSENELRNISRAATNQKNKFHEEAVEKILSHLSDKDKMTAKAIKAIIYDEIKQSKKELSGLDRAAEMLKQITKKKVDDVLKQKDLVNKIVAYLSQKNEDREKSESVESKSSNKVASTKSKMTGTTKTKDEKGTKGKLENNDFESSVELTSDYDSSHSESSSEEMRDKKKSKKGKKTQKLLNF